MAAIRYHHRQHSYFMLPIFLFISFAFLVVALITPEPAWLQALFYILSPFLLLLGIVFSRLTVTVDEQNLIWHFGMGFWRHIIARADIVHATPIKTKWWWGWGIRLTPHGWLYNVDGLDAVKVQTNAGRTVLIGTNEPDALVTALGFG